MGKKRSHLYSDSESEGEDQNIPKKNAKVDGIGALLVGKDIVDSSALAQQLAQQQPFVRKERKSGLRLYSESEDEEEAEPATKIATTKMRSTLMNPNPSHPFEMVCQNDNSSYCW